MHRWLLDASASAHTLPMGGCILQKLTTPEFIELLTSMGAKREYCTQYFKAFDHNQDGFVDYQEFLLGIVAMVALRRILAKVPRLPCCCPAALPHSARSSCRARP